MSQLKEQVAIVTGAAGGIGSAVAKLFAAKGAALALVDLAYSAGEEIAAQIRDSGGQAGFVAADVTQADQVAAAVQTTRDAYGKLTILANCVGILRQGRGKTDSAAQTAVIKEHCYILLPILELHTVRLHYIQFIFVCLPRRQDSEGNIAFRKHFEGFAIHGRFRQPCPPSTGGSLPEN